MKKGASAREQRPGQMLVLFKKLTFLSGVDLFVLVLFFNIVLECYLS